MSCKKIIFSIITLLTLVVGNNKVHAGCTDEALYQKAQDVNIEYKYNKETKAYDITFSHFDTDDILIYCDENVNYQIRNSYFDYNEENQSYTNVLEKQLEFLKIDRDNKIITITKVPSGSYTFKVFATTPTCEDELRVEKIKLGKYNSYADDERCNGVDIDEVPMCDPNYKGNVDEETFQNAISQWNVQNSLTVEEKPTDDKQENKERLNIGKTVIDFIKKNYVVVIIGIVVIVVISVLVQAIIKRRKKPGDLI